MILFILFFTNENSSLFWGEEEEEVWNVDASSDDGNERNR